MTVLVSKREIYPRLRMTFMKEKSLRYEGSRVYRHWEKECAVYPKNGDKKKAQSIQVFRHEAPARNKSGAAEQIQTWHEPSVCVLSAINANHFVTFKHDKNASFRRKHYTHGERHSVYYLRDYRFTLKLAWLFRNCTNKYLTLGIIHTCKWPNSLGCWSPLIRVQCCHGN